MRLRGHRACPIERAVGSHGSDRKAYRRKQPHPSKLTLTSGAVLRRHLLPMALGHCKCIDGQAYLNRPCSNRPSHCQCSLVLQEAKHQRHDICGDKTTTRRDNNDDGERQLERKGSGILKIIPQACTASPPPLNYSSSALLYVCYTGFLNYRLYTAVSLYVRYVRLMNYNTSVLLY
jgi:hypothetical protein